MFRQAIVSALPICRAGIRLNSSTASASTSSKVSSSIFPDLSKVKAEQVFGTTPFGGAARTYFIKRSRTGHLPIYSQIKAKGRYTEIRKIVGNIIQFRADLIEALPHINPKEVKISQQSTNLMIKGNHVEEIKALLATKF